MKRPTAVISDRRAHERHALRTEATIELPDGRKFLGRTLDIGKGGMAVVVDINPDVGASFLIHARLPVWPSGNAAFQARVSVASCVLAPQDGGFRLGLQFTGLDPAATEVLTRFLPS